MFIHLINHLLSNLGGIKRLCFRSWFHLLDPKLALIIHFTRRFGQNFEMQFCPLRVKPEGAIRMFSPVSQLVRPLSFTDLSISFLICCLWICLQVIQIKFNYCHVVLVLHEVILFDYRPEGDIYCFSNILKTFFSLSFYVVNSIFWWFE